jgi:tetraprenyl-beta-curcumene synthase
MTLPGMSAVLWRHVRAVLPAVDRELAMWQRRAQAIPHPELRKQALASLTQKRFHCQGGAVFAAAAGPYRQELLRFIVALQTISDYLDNLCDRAGTTDDQAFRGLHAAMLAAVQPVEEAADPQADYYATYPFQGDGGYLAGLVAACCRALSALPSYGQVQAQVERLVKFYCDLQVYKHMAVAERGSMLRSWFAGEGREHRDLLWQEFAAACGSTLGVFALANEAAQHAAPDARALLELYFPWVCGLHILLDYFIDLAEDMQGGDLNFVTYYPDLDTAVDRMIWLYEEAGQRLRQQRDIGLHRVVLHGLPALYLSDGKVREQRLEAQARRLLSTGGAVTGCLHLLCCMLR